MHKRFLIVIVTVSIALGWLVYSGVQASAKSVVTVDELVQTGIARKNIRLGARVAAGDIRFVTEPVMQLSFTVRDITDSGSRILVVYNGLMPDTFQENRDVILEGNFDGTQFQATQLMTQCPSKYEPPAPAQ